MKFEITKSFLDELSEAIAQNDQSFIEQVIVPLHPADIAEILDYIDADEARFIFKVLNDELSANTIVELNDGNLEKFLNELPAEEISRYIHNMDTDDAADIIALLDHDKKIEVFQHLEGHDNIENIRNLLIYPEDTAGGLMAKEYIKANINWPVNRCVVEMRKQAENVEKVYTIYVVDDQERLKGTLSLKSLLFASPKTLIKDLYMEDAEHARANMQSDEVARIMEKYDLVVLPVIDSQDRLIGRITIDDVVDVIKEEAEKDYQMASGLSGKVETSDTVWRLSKARLPWLLIGLIGGILGAQVISNYESDIQINPALAYFIPLIAAMGGNVGVQSSAIVVQGLANKTLDFSSISSKLSKETLVALINGVVCSLVIFGYNVLMDNSYDLAFTVGLSLITVVVFAAIFGTFVPLALDRYKIDPALATGPFITTVNDVLGLFIYFMIGRMMYGI